LSISDFDQLAVHEVLDHLMKPVKLCTIDIFAIHTK